jgi:hypothetical protein
VAPGLGPEDPGCGVAEMIVHARLIAKGLRDDGMKWFEFRTISPLAKFTIQMLRPLPELEELELGGMRTFKVEEGWTNFI